MENGEALTRLRTRMVDALKTGVVDEKHHGLVQQVLLQIMNDAERQRQACLSQVEAFKNQIVMAQGQANGYAAIASIVYGTIDGFIKQTERAAAEVQEAAIRDGLQPLTAEQPKKRGRKKKNVANPA